MEALQEQIKKNAEAEKVHLASRTSSKSAYSQMMDEADSLMSRAEKQRKSFEKASAGVGFIMAALFAVMPKSYASAS
jgi:hypothetical protein